MISKKMKTTITGALIISAITMMPMTAFAYESIPNSEIKNGNAVINNFEDMQWDQAIKYYPVIKRLAGSNRITTAIDIGKEKNQKNGTVVIVNSDEFADALSSAAFVRQNQNATLLLNPTSYLDNDVKNEIVRRNPSKIIILGGTGAISSNVESNLKSLCSNVTRVWGANRYKTAVAIGDRVTSSKPADTVFLADGENYPDALAASTFAAKNGYPILFTKGGSLNEDSKLAIPKWGIKNVTILGGEGVISANVQSELASMSLNVTRLGGANRYETAKMIVEKYYDSSYSGLTVCTGENFPDSLAAVSLAAEKSMPVMLYSPYNPQDIKDFIKGKFDKGYIIGGEGVLPSSSINSIAKVDQLSANALTATVVDDSFSPYSQNTVTSTKQWVIKFNQQVNLSDLKFYALKQEYESYDGSMRYYTEYRQQGKKLIAQKLDANTVIIKYGDANFTKFNIFPHYNGRYGIMISKDTKSTSGNKLDKDLYVYYQVKDSQELGATQTIVPFDIY